MSSFSHLPHIHVGFSLPPHVQATKLFVSNLNARLAQRFLALVLLPRVRHEIRVHQKLHFALFMALKKATYKPGAFYKVCVTMSLNGCSKLEAKVQQDRKGVSACMGAMY
jgi:hypothetical protein